MENKFDFGFDISDITAYLGYLTSDDELIKSASGGAGTAIAKAVLSKNGVVFGVRYSDDFKTAEYTLIDDENNLEKIKSSKYISARKEVKVNGKYLSVYKLLADTLNSGKTAVFFGLGCDIAAVVRYCENNNIDTTNLYTIDLICHGTTLNEVASQYIDSLEKKYKSKITDLNVRYKKRGWGLSYLRAEFSDGEVFEDEFYETDYGKAFNKFSRECCYNCKCKGQVHLSDVTIGDHWGISKDSDLYNKNGVSILFANTEKGNDLIKALDNQNFKIQEFDTETALQKNKNYYKSRNKNPDYDKFVENLKNKGLHYAVSHSYSVSDRIKMKTKHIVKKIVRK